MGTGFDTRGMANEIQQVGISGMIQTSRVDHMPSVQFGSDKNHLSVDQMNRLAEGYVTFWVILSSRKT